MLRLLGHTPTDQQAAVIDSLCRFVAADGSDGAERVFILNGYAGTGKTSVMGALVGALEAARVKVILLAPTGRAAKVFSASAGARRAFTIHRRIYRHSPGASAGNFADMTPADNPEHDAVFIVDEASMIGAGAPGERSLLHDLLQYVFGGDRCRLILLGDTAQLPPVGSDRSPAMSEALLRSLGLRVTKATMTATVRQRAGSGILANATRLRRAMLLCARAVQEAAANKVENPDLSAYIPKIRAAGFADVTVVEGEELPELLEKAYSDSVADAIVITRSNRRAREFNQGIRASILWREEELVPGDLLIVSRNRYFSGKKPGGVDFIANGDIVTIERVYGTETRYGMRFADVSLLLADGHSIDTKIMLDTLVSDQANLTQEQWQQLYSGVVTDDERYAATPVSSRLGALPRDPYWTALQVKYAYAITCHKAQGGQWEHVFIDLAYIPPEALDMTFYRWLYTAVTRARSHLYLISPPPQMVDSR